MKILSYSPDGDYIKHVTMSDHLSNVQQAIDTAIPYESFHADTTHFILQQQPLFKAGAFHTWIFEGKVEIVGDQPGSQKVARLIPDEEEN